MLLLCLQNLGLRSLERLYSASIKKGIKSQNLYLKDGGELTSDHIEVANVLDNHFIDSVRWIISGL